MIYESRGTIQPLVYFRKVIKTTATKLFVIYFTFLSNLQVPQFENLETQGLSQVISDQDASSSWKAHDSGVPKVKCLKSYVDKIQFEKYENF